MKIKNKSTKNIKKYKSLSNEQLGEIIGEVLVPLLYLRNCVTG